MWTTRQIINRAKLICDIVLSCSLMNKDDKKEQRDLFVKLINMLDSTDREILKQYWLSKYNNSTDFPQYESAVLNLIEKHKYDKIEFHKGKCKPQVGYWDISPRFSDIKIYEYEGHGCSHPVKNCGYNCDTNRKQAGLEAWRHNNECGFYEEI